MLDVQMTSIKIQKKEGRRHVLVELLTKSMAGQFMQLDGTKCFGRKIYLEEVFIEQVIEGNEATT